MRITIYSNEMFYAPGILRAIQQMPAFKDALPVLLEMTEGQVDSKGLEMIYKNDSDIPIEFVMDNVVIHVPDKFLFSKREQARLTPLQKEVLHDLRNLGHCLIANEAQRRWQHGKTYYIDARVDVKGVRHRFACCNRQALRGGKKLDD